ncbi:MAG: FHA domain-containing protein [Vicinamibacterales bacterium]
MAVPSSAPRTFKIGRAPDNDIVLADDSVSRRHAELVVTAQGELFLSDCHSRHGTAVVEHGVGRPVRQEVVPRDSTLRFGDVTMTATELMTALADRYPEIASSPGGVPRREAERPSRQWPKGARLVRCACGGIKPKGQRCQECGE